MTNTTNPVTVRKVATEWGTGQTTCFACDQSFTYPIGEPVDVLQAIDLCDQNCTPGSHKGTCTALGGDLCPICADQANNRPISFAMNLVLSATHHERRAAQLTAFATAVANAATTPGTECRDHNCGLTNPNLVHVDH